LLTGKPHMAVAALHCNEPDLFRDMRQYTDAQAGAWPARVVKGLAGVAERCIAQHARNRTSVSEVLPQLHALD
jgi:hypothetical protein